MTNPLLSQAQVTAALITGAVAIIAVVTTNVVQIVLRFLERRSERSRAILELRQEALHTALLVIDHVYANSSFDGRPPSDPHTWDINLAREAMNKMIIYCKDPRASVAAFAKAIGLHNPQTQTAPGYGPRDRALFISVICKELGI